MIPAVVAAFFLILSRYQQNRAGLADFFRCLAPAGALITGTFLAVGTVALPPVQSRDWMLLSIPALVIVSPLLRYSRLQWIPFLVALGFIYPLMGSALEYQWKGLSQIVQPGLFYLLWIIGTWSWSKLAQSIPSSAALFLLSSILGSGAICLLLSGSASYGQMAGMLAIGVGCVFLLRVLTTTATQEKTVTWLSFTWGFMLLLQGNLYAELTFTPILMLIGGPFLAACYFLIPNSRRTKIISWALGGWILLTAIAAIAIALLASQPGQSSGDYW